jgi:hypothetical protein
MPKGIYDRSKKVATRTVRDLPPTISLEQAIDTIANSLASVDGLDIKVWNDAVMFDIDGSRYTTTSYDAHKVLQAIKTLNDCKFD